MYQHIHIILLDPYHTRPINFPIQNSELRTRTPNSESQETQNQFMSVSNDDPGIPPQVPIKVIPRDVSNYTIQNVLDLNNVQRSYALPLAVIGLIDMNAFFAQVEQIRLGLTRDDPVVCAQWQSLIAVSYAARKFGISRMDTIASAKTKCPNLKIGHAAVFKQGESHWAYVEGLPNQSIHKVSLDPYRRESRKIFKILLENCDLVEKASVDECYLDLGRAVHQKLVETFPNLIHEKNQLPPIPSQLPSSLQWHGEIYKSETEESLALDQKLLPQPQKDQSDSSSPVIRDWDDICMLIGSKILLHYRQVLYEELGYTTSGGLARNKLLAKLAAGFKKPDNQTIIRTQLIFRFLNNFELKDVTGMGGKTGDIVVQKFDVPPDRNSITFLRENFTLAAIEEEIHDDLPLAKKIYEIVHGNHRLELNQRVDVKSMMSRKNFLVKKPVETMADAYGWVLVFAGDLYNRMIELDDESLNLSMLQSSNKEKGAIKRPKTVSIHLTTTGYSRHSKQAPIPLIRSLDKLKDVFETIGLKLLKEVVEVSCSLSRLNNGKSMKDLEGENVPLEKIKTIPIANLSLTISNFAKTSDSSLIDSYSVNDQSKENIEKMFAEVNKPIVNEEPTPPKKDNNISKVDKEYINKLFTEFKKSEEPTDHLDTKMQESTSSVSTTKQQQTQESAGTPKYEKNSAYISKLFKDFHETSQKFKEPSPPSNKRPHNTPKNDIFQALKRRKDTTQDNDSLLKSLIETQFCEKCQIDVNDAFEHIDYHMALDLSEKLNGG